MNVILHPCGLFRRPFEVACLSVCFYVLCLSAPVIRRKGQSVGPVTIVVSPLISLMEDQVNHDIKRLIDCTALSINHRVSKNRSVDRRRNITEV